MTLRGALRVLARALLRRCPNCGARPAFANWFRMLPGCPHCGLVFERLEPGYVVGAYMFNIVGAELVLGVLLVTILLLTWPSPPWDLLTYGGAALMVILPVVFYPFSKTLFLGFDLLFRPAGHEPQELARNGADPTVRSPRL